VVRVSEGVSDKERKKRKVTKEIKRKKLCVIVF